MRFFIDSIKEFPHPERRAKRAVEGRTALVLSIFFTRSFAGAAKSTERTQFASCPSDIAPGIAAASNFAKQTQFSSPLETGRGGATGFRRTNPIGRLGEVSKFRR
jgi:hypothetical protein